MVWFHLDDERGLPLGRDILVLDFKSMINIINLCQQNEIDFAIDFDYDLGDDYLTGYTIAEYIVSNDIRMEKFSIHSANKHGVKIIRELLLSNGFTESK